MKLRLNFPIDLSVFSHNKDTKTFCAEASDFGHGNLFQRIYDDACDVGFQVINPTTLNTILLIHSHEERTLDGMDVQYWEFTPSYEDMQKHPSLKGYKFVVYND